MTVMQPAMTNRKVQVARNGSPKTDRWVVLTGSRLLATDVFVVGVVDGTGRLTEQKSLLTTTDYERARRHANRLAESWGGVVEEDVPTAEFLERRYRRPTDYPDRRTTHWRLGTITELESPKQDRAGRWVVKWCDTDVTNNRPSRRRAFPTKQEAKAFHAELAQMRSN